MKEIAISEFKAKCLGILEEVRKTRKPIRVTRFGKPVAEVIPPSPQQGNGKAARIHGRNRQDPGRYRWPNRQLGRLGSLAVKLLLDTHIWLWSTLEPQRLTRRVDKALADPANELWLSPVSVGELIVLLRKGRLRLPNDVAAWVAKTHGRLATHRSAPHCRSGARHRVNKLSTR